MKNTRNLSMKSEYLLNNNVALNIQHASTTINNLLDMSYLHANMLRARVNEKTYVLRVSACKIDMFFFLMQFF